MQERLEMSLYHILITGDFIAVIVIYVLKRRDVQVISLSIFK